MWFLVNQMKNYVECMFILHTYDVHIEFNAMRSKRPNFEG